MMSVVREELEHIAMRVVDISFRIHSELGPGLLESVYQNILTRLLQKEGFDVRNEVAVDFAYHGIKFTNDLRMDLLINDKFIVELKAVEKLIPLYKRQLNTYLILMQKPLGLLVNFGGALFKNNCKRVVNIRHPLAETLFEESKFTTLLENLNHQWT